jgi:ABC-type sugar transport systems, ATPase components
MNLGVVEQIGRPIDVYDDPASLFVAGIHRLARDELPPGRRAGDEVELGGLRIALPAELREGAPDAITVGVRPEHLVPGEGAGGPVFRFEVETVEALGADSMVHGRFGEGTVVARVEGHSTPALGAARVFSVMPGKLYFFDTASGKRLRPRA